MYISNAMSHIFAILPEWWTDLSYFGTLFTLSLRIIFRLYEKWPYKIKWGGWGGRGNKYILMKRLLSMWHHRFVFSSSMYVGDIGTNFAHKIIKKICDIHKVLNYTKPLFIIFNTKIPTFPLYISYKESWLILVWEYL